jgi:hypothetical protein
MTSKMIFISLFAVSILTRASDAYVPIPGHRLSGAGGWVCKAWTSAGQRTVVDRAVAQWLMGYLSGRIGRDDRKRRFGGPDHIVLEARRYCLVHPFDLVEQAEQFVESRAIEAVRDGPDRIRIFARSAPKYRAHVR